MKQKKTIYLDNAATTGLDPGVAQAMRPHQGAQAGNAAALHRGGTRAALAVERARLGIARRLGAHPDELLFVSGGTEANNQAIKGTAWAREAHGKHLIVAAIEHASVLRPAEWLAARGWSLSMLPVDGQGRVEPDQLSALLREDTVLVSVAQGNSEVGTLQPLAALGAICRARGVWLHVDACQSFTRVPLDVGTLPVDLVSLNAHKLHGPTGVGALWVRAGLVLEPLLHGGSQERERRGGTSNTAGVVGFAAAVENTSPDQVAAMAALQQAFIRQVEARVPGARLNGSRHERLPHIVSFTFPGVDGRRLAQALDGLGIQVSTGSACAANNPAPSRVLLAMGVSPEDARSTLRISLSRWTTAAELDSTLDALVHLIPTYRSPA